MPSISSNRQAGQEAIEKGLLVKAANPPVNVAPPTPQLTDTNSLNHFLDSPLPASYIQQPDQQRQWQRGGVIPQERTPPLPPAANAQVGSSAQSQATIVINNTPAKSSGGGTTVTLNVPNTFTPTTQTGDDLTIAWASEPVGTFLGVNGIANAPYPDGAIANGGGTSVTTAITTVGQDLVVYFVAVDNLHGSALTGPGVGWTPLPGVGYSSGVSGVASQTDSAGTVATQSQSYTTNNGAFQSMSAALMTVSYSTTPVITARGNGGGGFQSIGVVGTPAAGEALLGFALINNNAAGGAKHSDIKSVTDSQNNIWFKVASTSVSGNVLGTLFGTGISVWFCPSPRTGVSTTFTFSAGTDAISATVGVVGITNLSPNTGIPVFSPINLNSLAGILGVASGGTAADLSQTGAAHSYVTQFTAGGPLSVQQPDFNDLAGAAGVFPPKYNGVTLVSNGLPSEVAKIDLTAQAANIGASTLYAVPAGGAGLYRVCSYIVMTTAASLTSTLPTVQLVYTDNDSNVSVTMDATPVSASAGLGQTGALNVNSVGSAASGVIAVDVRASTTIQYQTVNYASNAAGMQYALHIKLEAL